MHARSMFVKAWKKLPILALVSALLVLPAGISMAQASKGAATPEEAVSIMVRPFYDPSAADSLCNPYTGTFDACPITDQLRERLQNPIAQEPNLIARNWIDAPPTDIRVSLVDIIGDTARVNTEWIYFDGSYNIEFIVKKVAGSWLVADTFCYGNPHTSIFRTPVGHCSAESAAAAEAAAPAPGPPPGMPSTGAGLYLLYLLMGVLGTSATLAGALLVRHKKSRSRG